MPQLDGFSEEEKKYMESFMVKILRQSRHLKIYAKRSFVYDRIEVVVFTEDLELWMGIMEDHYEGIRKKMNDLPSQEDNYLTRAYGGVNDTQVLFSKQITKGATAFAMFWPWNDDEHMTIHMSFSKNSEGPIE